MYSATSASTITGKNLTWNGQNLAFSFNCSRLSEVIEPKMQTIYANAINGSAHFDMSPAAHCSHDQVVGGCGNLRGRLSECRCPELDRKTKPEARQQYEDRVIETIIRLIGDTKSDFKFKLAIFCSSQLLGEQILLFRLFDRLKKAGAQGSLDLFFIDLCYQPLIQQGNASSDPIIQQFIGETVACLPKGITLSTTFFGSTNSYVLAAENPKYKHHLLIGSDIETAQFDMGKTGKEAGLGVSTPIVLIKIQNSSPLICNLDRVGNTSHCSVPYKPIDPMLLSGALLTLVTITAIAIIILRKQ